MDSVQSFFIRVAVVAAIFLLALLISYLSQVQARERPAFLPNCSCFDVCEIIAQPITKAARLAMLGGRLVGRRVKLSARDSGIEAG